MKNPSINRCVDALRQGDPVLCLIEESSGTVRGTLILAAEKATPAGVNLLAREGKGVVCVGIDVPTARRFDLAPMVPGEGTRMGLHSVSTISIDARDGITTGISAADRAITLKLLTDDEATADHFVRPGHLFPYVAHEQGVLGHQGAAEAAVDLMRVAGLKPAGAFCGVLDEEGKLADGAYLQRLAARTGLALITMDDLVSYRLLHDPYLVRTEQEQIDSKHGRFILETYSDSLNQDTHYVLKAGRPDKEALYVHVHKACVKSDVFGAGKSESRRSLEKALQEVQESGGLLIYIGSRTSEKARSLAAAAQLIAKSGLQSVHLLGGEEDLTKLLSEVGVQVSGGSSPADAEPFGEHPKEAMSLLG